MLIKITDVCQGACSHCLSSCTPKGTHMSFEHFISAVNLATECNAKHVIISGGEPTLHPQYSDFIQYLKYNFNGMITITSNGLFINDDIEDARQILIESLDPRINFQITYDKRYYPKPLNMERVSQFDREFSSVHFIWNIGERIYPQGRARKHLKVTETSTGSVATKCFNIRSFTNSGNTFFSAVGILESMAKFCTPSINPDGGISIGESTLCPPIGHLSNYSNKSLTEATRESQCNECKMLNKLSPMHHIAIKYKGGIKDIADMLISDGK